MINKYEIAPTKEQSIIRIVCSIFSLVFGIFCVILFNKIAGVIIIVISSCIICFHLYYLIFLNKGLWGIEVKITIGKE